MFKRNATEWKMPADVDALSDAELEGTIDDLRRREVVAKKKLYDRCGDHRCRRIRRCAAGGGRCICADVPPMGRRDLKRTGAERPRRRWRF